MNAAPVDDSKVSRAEAEAQDVLSAHEFRLVKTPSSEKTWWERTLEWIQQKLSKWSPDMPHRADIADPALHRSRLAVIVAGILGSVGWNARRLTNTTGDWDRPGCNIREALELVASGVSRGSAAGRLAAGSKARLLVSDSSLEASGAWRQTGTHAARISQVAGFIACAPWHALSDDERL